MLKTKTMRKVYLDHAATTPMRQEVIDVMVNLMNDNFGNPSSTHAFGRKAKALIESSRKKMAQLLEVKSKEIVFTSGGTEADNLVIIGAVNDLGIKRIITSKIEHHAVLNCVEHLANSSTVEVAYVNLTEQGLIDDLHLEQLLAESDQPTLVSLMHINNEVGHINDLKQISEICQKYKALFHSDTVQSIGFYPIDLKHIPIDFLTASAHKFNGPKGIGFAIIKEQHSLNPLIFGGSQERGRRAGTENVYSVGATEKALTLAYENMDQEREHVKKLKTYCKSKLEAAFPNIRFNGASGDFNLSSHKILNFTIPLPKFESDMLILQLDLHGIACSKGSACQSGAQEGSFVLNEIYGGEQHGLRLSFSSTNSMSDIDYFVDKLKQILMD